MKEETGLLCTFTNKNNLYRTIKMIENECELVNNKVYIFENVDNKNELLITYNIYIYYFEKNLPYTVYIHRKKETNTLYSLNAMNEVIKKINGGILDKSITVPWEQYKNSFLILRNQELHKINTQLFSAMNIKNK